MPNLRQLDKTVVVLVETRRRHPLYKKVVTHISKFKAHDEANACSVGDVVKIVETRPLSKEKCWRVTEIVRKKEAADVGSAEMSYVPAGVEEGDSTTD